MRGEARREGSGYRLRGGAVVLAEDQRFDVHDGDLSFSAVAITQGIGTRQTVAQHPGSWRLEIREDGALELTIRHPNRDRRLRKRGKPRETILTTALVGAGKLGAGRPHRLAFSVGGNSRGGGQVRLYLDGALQATSPGIAALSLPIGPVHLGSANDPGASLQGTLQDVAFYLCALDGEEIARLATGSR